MSTVPRYLWRPATSRRPAPRPDWTIAATAGTLVLLTGVRLALAARLPLAPDEAYYWVWSRALAAGYVDHPPMIALWIRAGTAIAGDNAFGVRLLAPLSAAFASVLLWDAADRLIPGRKAGIVAVLLLNATILVGVGSILATPDSPLLFFWMGALWGVARLLGGGSGWWWLAVGVFVGLALASKYTAVFLALGVALWLAAAGRAWLRRPQPYLAALFSLAIFAPVLWWNAAHGWASFLRQGGRAGAWDPSRAPQYLLELVLGQAALATPLIFLLFVAGLAAAAAAARRRRDPAMTLLAILGLLPALVFFQHALGDRVQANWPAIIYPAAGIAAATLDRRFWRRLGLPAVALGFVMTGAVYVEGLLKPLPLAAGHDPIAMQTAGWRDLADAVEAVRRRTGAAFVAADQYGVAAELARTLPADVPVIAVGPRWASFDLPPAAVDAMKGLLIEPESHASPIWPASANLGSVERHRPDGAVIAAYRLYRVVPDRSTSAVRLPRAVAP
jgi:4-amino-4-deoxy-L-arabinose transferase-like glycosyltransferase